MGLLRADGLEPVAWPTLPDDPAQVESALRHAGNAFDVVLTCGAVSAGEKDHIPALLQAQGEVHFWKVRMKPGMPVLFASGGKLGDRSEEHTSELQSLMRISYAVFCLKKKTKQHNNINTDKQIYHTKKQ